MRTIPCLSVAGVMFVASRYVFRGYSLPMHIVESYAWYDSSTASIGGTRPLLSVSSYEIL